MSLESLIREVPDWPRPGITFKDLTPLLLDHGALDEVIRRLTDCAPADVDLVVAPEARGFWFGSALAHALGAGFVPARKPGKLPVETVSAEYELEYGVDALHVHADALAGGKRVLVHDDVLATGGTANALCEIVEAAGGVVVGLCFVLELPELGGRARLAGRDVHALVT